MKSQKRHDVLICRNSYYNYHKCMYREIGSLALNNFRNLADKALLYNSLYFSIVVRIKHRKCLCTINLSSCLYLQVLLKQLIVCNAHNRTSTSDDTDGLYFCHQSDVQIQVQVLAYYTQFFTDYITLLSSAQTVTHYV